MSLTAKSSDLVGEVLAALGRSVRGEHDLQTVGVDVGDPLVDRVRRPARPRSLDQGVRRRSRRRQSRPTGRRACLRRIRHTVDTHSTSGRVGPFIGSEPRCRARSRMIAKRMITRASSTLAAPYPRVIELRSGLRTPEKTNSGNEFIGSWNGSALKYADGADTMSTGAVSPMPRAIPRISAVARPGRAVGRTTPRTVRHWGAPEREAGLTQAHRARPAARPRWSGR